MESPNTFASSSFAFYSVVNTDFRMDQGTSAALIARSTMALRCFLERSGVKAGYIDIWKRSGEKIIILKGYGHKHLKYLEKEASYMAQGWHSIVQNHSHAQIKLILTVFGREEDLREIFEGLLLLK